MRGETLTDSTAELLESGVVPDLPNDVAPRAPLIEIPPCDWALSRRLETELGLHHLVAQTLVRRGITSVEAADDWLTADVIRSPELLPGAPAAADLIVSHVARGSRIAVHGDYDVDGVCSTVIMVRALANLGADVTWHVPSRFGDGYGLTRASVDRLVGDGAALIIAVDCGIGSVDEVAYARSLGAQVVICDHHTIGDQLPDAAIVHPGLSDYPDPHLCAAAATHKLAALVVEGGGGDPSVVADDLALVALATVCDVVPLVGENRALVRAGTEAMRTIQRPGIVELMRVAGVDQLRVSSTAFGFALGPRINAVGRMHSAEPAVELLLTAQPARATELAELLGSANHRRRETEQTVLHEAETQARSQRDKYAIVVASEGWHPGVLGIVAGRLADRYRRPVLALAIEDGIASGSGRSGGTYDLVAGLQACSELLDRYGGHRAAAGLALPADRLENLRVRLAADAESSLSPDDLRPRLTIDAIADAREITLDTVAALERLAPFGAENPAPKALLAGAELVQVSRMGKSGEHFRLGVAGEGARATIVAFRQERAIAAVERPRAVDLVLELQRNEFNGREEAQAVLQGMIEREATNGWSEEFERALSDSLREGLGGGLDVSSTTDRRGVPLAESILEFGADGSDLAVVVNDPVWLRNSLAGVLTSCLEGALEVLAYDDPRLDRGGFDHVLLAEPPPAPAFASFGSAHVVTAWSDHAERDIGMRADSTLLSREHLVTAFRAVRENAGDLAATLAALETLLPGARIAGRAVKSLDEIDVLEVKRRDGRVDALETTDSGRKELEQSFTFRSYSEYRGESQQWLRQLSETARTR